MTPSRAVGVEGFPRSVAPPEAPRLDAETRQRTRSVLEEAARGRRPDAILLSGGLDSSITAHVASGVWGRAICVLGPEGTDRPYAAAVADALGLRLRRIDVALDELLDHVPDVTRILDSFDPMRVRNAVVQYVGLRAAREEGARLVATGDGADELFCGYSYMMEMDPGERRTYRRHIAEIMTFSAEPMAEDLGMRVWSPFLEGPVRDHALSLPDEALVGDHAGRPWGKRVLREAFRGSLPDAVLWRRKDPLEVGAGSRALASILADRLGDALDDEAQRIADEENVRLRSAEQLAYYRAYRRHHPPPADRAAEDRRCPACRGPLGDDATYCRTCGWHGGELGADDAPDGPDGQDRNARTRLTDRR